MDTNDVIVKNWYQKKWAWQDTNDDSGELVSEKWAWHADANDWHVPREYHRREKTVMEEGSRTWLRRGDGQTDRESEVVWLTSESKTQRRYTQQFCWVQKRNRAVRNASVYCNCLTYPVGKIYEDILLE